MKTNNCLSFPHLQKHDGMLFASQLLNDIVFNEKSSLTATFKENLIFDDKTEFMKRYYASDEITTRLCNYFKHYSECSMVFPNYTKLDSSRFIYKNIQRKQKILDLQQESIAQLSFSSVFDTQLLISIVSKRSEEKENKAATDIEELIERIEKASLSKISHKRPKSSINQENTKLMEKFTYIKGVFSKQLKMLKKRIKSPVFNKRVKTLSESTAILKKPKNSHFLSNTQINLITNINFNYNGNNSHTKNNTMILEKSSAVKASKSKEKPRDKKVSIKELKRKLLNIDYKPKIKAFQNIAHKVVTGTSRELSVLRSRENSRPGTALGGTFNLKKKYGELKSANLSKEREKSVTPAPIDTKKFAKKKLSLLGKSKVSTMNKSKLNRVISKRKNGD